MSELLHYIPQQKWSREVFSDEILCFVPLQMFSSHQFLFIADVILKLGCILVWREKYLDNFLSV